ncbi:M15 family metallopeptidase [Thermoactinospora rubra]|uniref:M15 family metallopeptidase n=1 Tax=Thermoactinospora rubra TaxID=1088767 RepID=UPI00146F9BD7|nr:M15 family metallopeptidase [Thermoactinospora rubra]
MMRPAVLVGMALVVAACSTGEPAATSAATSPPSPSSTPASAPSSAPSPSPRPTTPPGPPKFAAQVSKVPRDRVPYSWRPGCPVPLGDLRLIKLTYWGFDDKAHTGELVVHERVADDVVTVFGKLYGWRWPIRRMELVDVYKGSDFDSIEADNTSAFNCRRATGSSSWSKHAYGQAIDINPRENPYVTASGTTAHANAQKFKRRPLQGKGVINPGDRVVRAFEALGWEWGGYWSGTKDYQHFSKGGG